MNNLRNDEVKLEAVRLDSEGFNQAQIGEALGTPRTSIGDFLRKETYSSWWAEFDNECGSPSDTTPTLQLRNKASVLHYVEPVKIATRKNAPDNCTHLMIPDLQVKPDIDTDYLRWVGDYIADKKPDVLINIGDHFDLPSLSSYDKGTKKAEGKRLSGDIAAGIRGMNLILQPIADIQAKELEEYGEIKYKPKMVFTIGNHEFRLDRHINANPELHGLISYADFKLEENGWEVYDFLEPAMVHGITYIHYQPNPMSGKPYGGTALNILSKVGESFCVGHAQKLDVATRFLPTSGKQQWGIVAGACYDHFENYKGYCGNKHWRGLVVMHQVSDGSFNPMFVDLEYLKNRYNRKKDTNKIS